MLDKLRSESMYVRLDGVLVILRTSNKIRIFRGVRVLSMIDVAFDPVRV